MLFDDSRAEGHGIGIYLRVTTNKDEARRHYRKCADEVYGTGYVDIVVDGKAERAWCGTIWENL